MADDRKMAHVIKRYLWLLETIYQADGITLKEINDRWINSDLSGGEELPRRTFNNHIVAIKEIFGITIKCNDKSSNKYVILHNYKDIKLEKMQQWVANALFSKTLFESSAKLRRCIDFGHIPNGQRWLPSIANAMIHGKLIFIRYRGINHMVEPYYLKLFQQHWILWANDGKKRGMKTFDLDIITSIKTMKKHFHLEDDFDPGDIKSLDELDL